MRFRPLLRSTAICAAPVLFAAPAMADPAAGVGLTFTFGGGQPEVGLGLRIFSDDREDEWAASVGVDYMFGSQSWRGALGAAYLLDNSYVEITGGYDFGSGTLDVGLGGGLADTAAAPAATTGPIMGGGEGPPPQTAPAGGETITITGEQPEL